MMDQLTFTNITILGDDITSILDPNGQIKEIVNGNSTTACPNSYCE